MIFLISYSLVYGQKENFNWIKPAKTDTENYKLARKLYKKSSYEAGYLSIDYKLAKKLFSGKSGLAVESIPATDLLEVPLWQSDTYKQKLELDKLAGSITSVKKSRELFNESKSNAGQWKMFTIFNDKIEIPLRPMRFSIATFADSKDTIRNLVVIRKGKICKIQPFKNYDGALFQTPFPEISFQFSRPVKKIDEQITTNIMNDTISFRMYYDRGKTEPGKEETLVFRDQISTVDDSVTFIEVTGFASIEGNLELNKKLYAARVNGVLETLKRYFPGEIKSRVHSQENWKLFRSQISRTEYEYLAGLSKEQVREFVNKQVSNPELISMLEEQRYVEVKIISTYSVNHEIIPASPLVYYKKLLSEVKDNNYKVGSGMLRILEEAQINVYLQYLEGNCSYEEIELLEIPKNSVFRCLHFNKLVLDYLSKKNQNNDQWFFDQFIRMGVERKASSHLKRAVKFNTQLLLFKAVEDDSLSYFLDPDLLPLRAYRDYIFNLIPASSSKTKAKELDERLVLSYLPRYINAFKGNRLSQAEEEQLYRYYYTHMISSYYISFYPETKKKAQRQLYGIYRYFAEDKINDNELRISVARLYMVFQKWDKAITTLAPLLDDPAFGTYATQLTLSSKQFTIRYEDLIEEILSARFDIGYDSWVEMFEKPEILGPRFFDNARIREYYFSR